MPFLTQGPERPRPFSEKSGNCGVYKTNWKFIAVVAVLAIIVGTGILFWNRTEEVPSSEFPPEEDEEDREEDKIPVVKEELPIEIVSHLEFQEWLERWQSRVTSSILDNFAKKIEGSFGYYGEFTDEQFEHFTRSPDEFGEGAILKTYSPDKSKLLIIDASPPDTGVYLLDLENRQIANVGYCGTPCTFDQAFWLNDSKFIFTSISFLQSEDYPELWEMSLGCQRTETSCLVFSVKMVNLEDNSSLDYYTLYLSRFQ